MAFSWPLIYRIHAEYVFEDGLYVSVFLLYADCCVLVRFTIKHHRTEFACFPKRHKI